MTNTTPISLCSVDECERPSHSRGYCAPHYSTWHRSQKKYTIECKACGKKVKVSRSTATTCSRKCAAIVGSAASAAGAAARWADYIPKKPKKPEADTFGCVRCGETFESATARKYCGETCRRAATELRSRALRSPLRAAVEDRDYEAIIEAVRQFVRVDAEGCWVWQRKINDGYPEVQLGKKFYQVHRLVLEAKEGRPLGVQAAHHACANSTCVNPQHLQPVTHRENTAEMLARRSYIDRIRELERALENLDPGNELLNRVSLF